MTAQAAEARKAYKRAWAKKNPDRIKQYQSRYWEKKAAAAAEEAEAASRSATPRAEQEGGEQA